MSFAENNKLFDNNIEKDDLDLRLILNFFKRNKKIVSLYSLSFFLTTLLLSFFIKKVWQGQFEIVLDQDIKGQNQLLGNNQLLNQFGSIDSANSLKTEVGILESPSVLMPIFKSFILDKNPNKSTKNKIRFVDWKENNLDINLKKNTSILSITYRDKNKELIIPVLNGISQKYQEYSGKALKRSNELIKIFLENQVQLYKDTSSKSLQKVQSFAIDQNLLGVSTMRKYPNAIEKNTFNINPSLRNVEIEKIRANAANKIRDIDLQIEKINNLDDINKLQYIGSTIPGLRKEGLPAQLREIEENLLYAKLKFTKDDIKIKEILRKRSLLVGFLKKRSIGYLQAQRLLNESIMESATRPKETLLKYKELIRQANRDESTLIDLENKLRLIEIEEAKLLDPWQLITIPNLEDRPVYPNKILISFIGLFFGFAFGSVFSFIKEKNNGLILDENILFSYLHNKPVIKLSKKNGYFYPNNLQIPIEEITNDFNLINFIYTSNFDNDFKNKFSSFLINYFSKLKKEINILNSDESLKKNNNGNLIIVCKIDDLSFKEIDNLKKRINLLNLDLISIFLIS